MQWESEKYNKKNKYFFSIKYYGYKPLNTNLKILNGKST